MGNREGRRPAHMASSKKGNKSGSRSGPERTSGGRASQLSSERSGNALQDNYYYEEPNQFEDMSSYSSSKRQKGDRKELERQRKGKKWSKGKKAAVIIAGVVVLLVAAGLWYVFGYMLNGLTVKNITRDPEKLGINLQNTSGTDSEADFDMVMDDSIKNIALFGVDARDDSFEGRSDVVMVLTVDNKHDSVKMVSILRDSCVDIDGYGYDKLTHAYAYGGPELAINTLNRNFHLDITDYVTVNFTRMAEIVDAVGGVEMELTADEVREVNRNLYALNQEIQDEIENDQYNGTYEEDNYAKIYASDYFPDDDGNLIIETDNYSDGTYTLNGNRAVAYMRIRYLDSDDVRTERQQKVLTALINKVRGKSKLEYPEMIRKIMPMCETSLSFSSIVGMLPIMFTEFDIQTMRLPSETESPSGAYIRSDCWVYLYDLSAAAKHLSQFIYESDSPYFGQEIVAGDPGIPTVDSVYYNDFTEYSDGDGTEDPVSSTPESFDPVSSWTEDPGWTEDPDPGWEAEDPSSSGWTEDPVYEDPGYEDPGNWTDPGTDGSTSGGTGYQETTEFPEEGVVYAE